MAQIFNFPQRKRPQLPGPFPAAVDVDYDKTKYFLIQCEAFDSHDYACEVMAELTGIRALSGGCTMLFVPDGMTPSEFIKSTIKRIGQVWVIQVDQVYIFYGAL